jgi:hypothetical protein
MMEALVQLDPKGNGRVPLSTFYSQPPSADYQFKEAASALAYFQSLTSSSSSCEVLKAGNAVGLKVPDTVVQQWLLAKITEFGACKCWAHETGELAFQMYNMKALTMKSDVCLLQADPKEPLNPYGCLMSLHEDGRVIAAVSDFDAFLNWKLKTCLRSPGQPAGRVGRVVLGHMPESVSGCQLVLGQGLAAHGRQAATLSDATTWLRRQGVH